MVISDSTALIILFDLDRIELLENLFDVVYVPPIVLEEISVRNPVKLPSFMKVKTLNDDTLVLTLEKLLDPGESEAIALAKQMGLAISIDEKKGRKIAKSLELRVIGLLGVVYLNVKKGFLTKDEAKVFLDDAVAHGYRISKTMVADVLGQL